LKCRFYKREKGEVKKNLCMAEVAIMGDAGDPYLPSDNEVIDVCLSEDGFKNCTRFQWVEREKDKEMLRRTY
jgi:hypothetical protein